MAQLAVIIEPLLSPASTTSTPLLMPEIIRLRMGNVVFDAGVNGANSEITAPFLLISSLRYALCIRYLVPRPQPRTATVLPPALSAP